MLGLTKALCAATMAALIGASALAAEMEPLEHWLLRPDDEREPSYQFVRCAGLYAALRRYAGVEQIGPEMMDQYAVAMLRLALATAHMRAADRGGEPADYAEQVTQDLNSISHLYEDRMRQNYAASGQAIMSDPLMRGDIEHCQLVSATVDKD